MSKDGRNNHLSPEILLDFAESTPVDASWTEHLSGCEPCSARVRELQRALTDARELVPPSPGKAYWADFGSRLRTEIAAESEMRKSRSRRWWWAIAAGVSLALAGWLAWEASRPTAPMPEMSAETLLPPAEQDQEFQFLLSFAEIVQNPEDIEETLYLVTYAAADPSQLTAEEQEQLREKLENLLKVGENEKS